MKTKFINQPFSKRAVMVLAVLLTALTAGATEFITEVKLIGAAQGTEIDKLIAQYEGDGWKRVKPDLNSGIPEGKGDWVYLLYKTAENTDGLNHGYITDFYLQNKGAASTGNTLTHNGRTYNLTLYDGDSHFMSVKGDLNSGTGWDTDAIHLYYTRDPFPDNRAVTGVSVDQNQSGAVGKEGSSTAYDLNSGCEALTSKKLYLHFTTAAATTMPAVKYISYSYDSQKGLMSKEETCYGYYTVTSSTTMLKKGWYVVNSSVAIDKRITVSGTVNLILCDGCTLEAKEGIEVAEGNTLNIFAQSEGVNVGSVKAYGFYSHSGIGGGVGRDGGTVTIYGGMLEVHGGGTAAGIGGGIYNSGGMVTIYGGTVEVHGGYQASGIGGGFEGSGGTVTIYGGMVKAYGGKAGAGIGAGLYGGSHGTLKIGDGVYVYGGYSENPTTLIAAGPQENVESRPQFMIAAGHIKGDANDDVRVNAADLVEMVNAKNNKASDRFVLKNADIDGSGKITQEDIDAVVKIILKKI